MSQPRITRRALLSAFGAGAAGAAVVAGGAVAIARTQEQAPADLVYPFYGTHQGGITTPMQNFLHFAALNITTPSRDQLVEMFRRWSQAAAAMTAGQEVGAGAISGSYDAPPDDTGDAMGLPASGLTITFGFGPTLFRTADGIDRFGIADRIPSSFGPLPHFPGDALIEAVSGGDVCIQACAHDPQVAVHAVRNLVRLAFGTASVKWSQTGYGQSSSTSHASPTPRNLFGFKDGTANITGEEYPAQDDFVWVQPHDLDSASAWMAGGSYLAVRKIKMTIETWDRSSLREQESVFGRTKLEGAPLSGGSEFAQPDFAAKGGDGQPLIPVDSHVALAHPSSNDGARILRRAYNYADGTDGLGRLDAGLFFLAYCRDLDRQFIPLQLALARNDRMNEYVRYLSSASFAIPPAAGATGEFVGEGLFT